MNARALSLACTTAVAVGGCTDVSLQRFSDARPEERAEIRATLCTTDEERVANTLYVIVADVSRSMLVNDPEAKLVVAVQRAVDQILATPGAAVGIVSYSDSPHVLTTPSNDPVRLAAATRQLATRQGGTNYTDSLRVASELIVDEIALLPAGVASATHVYVKFFSDGFPTVGGTVPELILPIVDDLVEATEHRVARLSVDTYYLPGYLEGTDEAAAAESLLATMAERGHGAFTRFTDPDLIEFDVETTTIVVRQSLAGVTAFLANAVFEQGWRADGDTDGIADVDELARGLDPDEEDTDGDGLRDGVEDYLGGRFDPLVPDPECADAEARSTDVDGDGLRACEEGAVGTSDLRVDSDNDLLPDRFEVARGSNPVIDNPLFDRDGDGGPDQTLDVPGGFDARRANSVDEFAVDSLGYSFGAAPVPEPASAPGEVPTEGGAGDDATGSGYPLETPDDAEGDGPSRCFAIRVDNVPVVAGTNRVELVAFLSAEEGLSLGRVARRARGTFYYDPELDVLAPAHAALTLTDGDFEPW